MKKTNKGQTFVEFLLVFLVLLMAASGALVLYKTSWEKRYEKTASVSGAGAVIVDAVGIADRSYVK